MGWVALFRCRAGQVYCHEIVRLVEVDDDDGEWVRSEKEDIVGGREV